MKKYSFSLLLSGSLILSIMFNPVFAQTVKKPIEPKTSKGTVSNVKSAGDTTKQGPKPYKTVITDRAKTHKGLMTVHKIDDKYYFEISDSLLGRDIMTVTRYSKTAAGGGIFGGEEVNRQMVRWEKGPDNKIFLRSVTIVIASPDSTKPMFRAVENSSEDPIVAAFDIKAIRKDTSSVIDITNYFSGDPQVFSISPMRKQYLKLASLETDRSFIKQIHTFPTNTEIRTIKTFAVTPPSPPTSSPSPQVGQYLPAGLDAGFVTMEFNTSMLLLPGNIMRKRYFDPRVGYFSISRKAFEENSQRSDDEVFVERWRLEPKNEADAQRQKKGELIEPKKPIVFYIDPATPVKWRKYLVQGIDAWEPAFEKAGWKNAIRGEYWNEKDSSMSLEDARFSVIRYFASDIQNAYGPNVSDPRSGEILESHIGWYHNVMRLLHNWYLIQTAASDPRAQKNVFDEDLMGQLVRFVCSHEVGHTLGLRHNMGASSKTPVEKLRDKNWLAQYGNTPSIMDYARFNYVAQPEDSIKDFIPRIGDYDTWAIKWGYSYFHDAGSANEEKQILNTLTREALKNPRLEFGTEISPYDPRYQTEDLGDNAMKASGYGIKNLQRILPDLPLWSREDGESYKELAELYDNLAGQFRLYLGHVAKNIGGIYDTPKTYDSEGYVFEVVPREIQKEAVSFLNSQIFTTPEWILNQDILKRIRPDQGVDALKKMQESVLNNVLAGDKLFRLMETGGINSSNYNIDELFLDLRTCIMSEIKSHKPIDIYRRNLQKVFVEKMISFLNPGSVNVFYIPQGAAYDMQTMTVDLKKTDLPSIARGHLESMKMEIKSNRSKFTDELSNYHLDDLLQRIDNALNPLARN
jgi:Met-zincin/Domain of unknown function (DUF5117)/Domain of unknown function (DUF5118)